MATGVEFSVTCRFFHNYEENIVTAGANVLKVFRIIPDVAANTTEKYTGRLMVFFIRYLGWKYYNFANR